VRDWEGQGRSGEGNAGIGLEIDNKGNLRVEIVLYDKVQLRSHHITTQHNVA